MAAGLAPIAYGSSIVGFISFAFTFFTFLRVFWDSIETMWAAPKEVRQSLDNLRTELYGERAYFKNAIKQARSKSRHSTRETPEIGPLSILNDSIKSMMRDFRNMEAPFLDRETDAEDLDVEKSGKVSLRGNYGRMDLRRRWRWLHSRSDFMELANQVTRIQSRRIAYETSNTLSPSVLKSSQALDLYECRVTDVLTNQCVEKTDYPNHVKKINTCWRGWEMAGVDVETTKSMDSIL
ncbi:MAG: hypothetical protein Q9222_005267 [Ikaeria aurantiellina]